MSNNVFGNPNLTGKILSGLDPRNRAIAQGTSRMFRSETDPTATLKQRHLEQVQNLRQRLKSAINNKARNWSKKRRYNGLRRASDNNRIQKEEYEYNIRIMLRLAQDGVGGHYTNINHLRNINRLRLLTRSTLAMPNHPMRNIRTGNRNPGWNNPNGWIQKYGVKLY
jgi:hypothetical protein